jgi:hypothetical protein
MAGTRWVKIDVSYLRNPKLTAVSAPARLLHLASICWCADQLTDGHIPRRILIGLAHEAGIAKTWAERRAAELEQAGLWEPNGRAGGWEVHDFALMNPQALRAAVEKERQRWRDRQAKRRTD